MSRYVYHYHASQQIGTGSFRELDGLLLRGSFVQTESDYRSVKEAIAASEGLESKGLVLKSFSFLGFEIVTSTVEARQ